MHGKPVTSSSVFALVAYIPGPLGAYLNELRAELVSENDLVSHLTVLPPRVLAAPEDQLAAQLETRLSKTPAFEVALGKVEIFPLTDVIFLSVEGGRGAIEEVHDELDRGDLQFDEPFEFHPHVTLAQEVEPDVLLTTYRLAQTRWEQCPHPRSFSIEKLTFVRNVNGEEWRTVSEHTLAGVNPQKKA
jgi:2'-5' RNA ligase